MTTTFTMTNEEINARLGELSKILDMGITPQWDEAYDEYMTLSAILEERYRDENMDDFIRFFQNHIEGKSFNEVDPDIFNTYSDWHKDMFGYRPRTMERDW